MALDGDIQLSPGPVEMTAEPRGGSRTATHRKGSPKGPNQSLDANTLSPQEGLKPPQSWGCSGDSFPSASVPGPCSACFAGFSFLRITIIKDVGLLPPGHGRSGARLTQLVRSQARNPTWVWLPPDSPSVGLGTPAGFPTDAEAKSPHFYLPAAPRTAQVHGQMFQPRLWAPCFANTLELPAFSSCQRSSWKTHPQEN